ncbi:MarR family winged helix-turn-helix transcriptional regulator [Tepidibacillus sp. HK-1]|uniref:MarR family winged helix-turn-helix transcriptional regulator n=1 Tax=Tepidibacillus sp. HK-1 TaxID=1883407 RepID=UPI00085312CE|nr:MarR family transcriptional regulator [Tepidibacillus sp. HK-1]GBF10859.1 putative HTH-type transcriptional regulator YusO [Tepidibacillus sp. HK-1]
MEHPRQQIEKIEYVLRKISGIIKRKGREILNDFPITPPQFVALQWLNEEGDMTIGELSNKMFLAFSTTTDLIDRMEKNHLVERVRNQKDRRVVQIHLLEKGKQIISDVLEARRDYLSSILLDMEPKEVEKIQLALQQLFEKMDKDI